MSRAQSFGKARLAGLDKIKVSAEGMTVLEVVTDLVGSFDELAPVPILPRVWLTVKAQPVLPAFAFDDEQARVSSRGFEAPCDGRHQSRRAAAGSTFVGEANVVRFDFIDSHRPVTESWPMTN